MAGITSIHDALGRVDSSARGIEVGVDVGDAVDRAGIDTDAQF